MDYLPSLFFALMALAAGMLLPVQFGINSQLARMFANPLVASTISFWVGTIALTGLTLVWVRSWPPLAALRDVPLSIYLIGGLLGATFLTTNIFLVPRLGSAATLCLVIAGQLLAALLIDQFGWFNLALRAVTLGRATGALLVLVGAIMVRLL
jgi:bacterial/archaeal transporter family-2 protein